MSIEADIAMFLARLDEAIDSAMQGPVLDGAKRQIQDTARSNVYSYQPIFYSRRMMSGGLMDEGNMKDSYGDKTLLIQNMTGWQHLYGGAYPGEMLAEAIANGDAAYHFDKAGARSFMPEAEQAFAPEFERILGSALRAAGF
jgi:hypothetical protein